MVKPHIGLKNNHGWTRGDPRLREEKEKPLTRSKERKDRRKIATDKAKEQQVGGETRETQIKKKKSEEKAGIPIEERGNKKFQLRKR